VTPTDKALISTARCYIDAVDAGSKNLTRVVSIARLLAARLEALAAERDALRAELDAIKRAATPTDR